MNRFVLIILVVTAFVANTKGQGVKIKESKFYNITEIGYGVGVGKINFEDVNIKVDNSSKYFRLRTQFGYMLSEKFSLGLGVGLDGYHEYTFNTAPLFIDTRYYLKNQPQTFFIFSNLGYAIPLADNFEKGFMGGIALGRKISTKRLIVLPSIGLNIQQLQDISYYAPSTGSNLGDNIQLMSVQLNLGLMF